MVTRILKLLKEENLTASQFADLIDVQRSSMSHILSGRNNPSLDFVHKTLKAFPNVNTDWLMSGVGEMYKNNISTSIKNETPNAHPLQNDIGILDLFGSVSVDNKDVIPEIGIENIKESSEIAQNTIKSDAIPNSTVNNLKSIDSMPKTEIIPPLELNISTQSEMSAQKIESPQDKKNTTQEKIIEKIVIFYSDKSFSIYNPE